jgi:hypothetical protein
MNSNIYSSDYHNIPHLASVREGEANVRHQPKYRLLLQICKQWEDSGVILASSQTLRLGKLMGKMRGVKKRRVKRIDWKY